MASRNVNANGAKRGKISELLVHSYRNTKDHQPNKINDYKPQQVAIKQKFMLKDFDKFMSQLKETNQTLDFFCDFDKISENVEDIKLSLCMLNSLIGASDLRKSVETIWNRDKNAFSVMDILIAVRTRDKRRYLIQ